MHSHQLRNTNLGIGAGFLVQLAGLVAVNTGDATSLLGMALILLGVPFFIWGCMNYAKWKGHSPWVGLVGLAGIIGLIVLVILPTEHAGGTGSRLARHKVVGAIATLAGLGIALVGAWLYHLGKDARLERMLGPWPHVAMLLGFVLVVGGVVFLVLDD